MAYDPHLAARQRQARLARLAHQLRWLNRAAIGFCLVLGLDWALPAREFRDEPLLRQEPVAAGGTLSNPQMAYRITTPHTQFRIRPQLLDRVQTARCLTVWQTPLLGRVRFIKAPDVVAGRTPFAPYGGGLYGSALAAFPLILFVVSGLGLMLPFAPETRLNTAVVSGLLLLVTLVLLVL